jgi:hypothetical protein
MNNWNAAKFSSVDSASGRSTPSESPGPKLLAIADEVIE